MVRTEHIATGNDTGKRSASSAKGELIVSLASNNDCVAIARIYNEAIADGRSTMDTEPVDAAYFEHFLRPGKQEVLLVGRTVAGVQSWGIVKRYSERPGYRYAAETSVYVAANAQGQGLGSATQAAVIEQATQRGYRHLVAKILAVNEASVRFHERFGFTVVGRQQAIGFLDGQWQDVIIMQRLLAEQDVKAETRE